MLVLALTSFLRLARPSWMDISRPIRLTLAPITPLPAPHFRVVPVVSQTLNMYAVLIVPKHWAVLTLRMNPTAKAAVITVGVEVACQMASFVVVAFLDAQQSQPRSHALSQDSSTQARVEGELCMSNLQMSIQCFIICYGLLRTATETLSAQGLGRGNKKVSDPVAISHVPSHTGKVRIVQDHNAMGSNAGPQTHLRLQTLQPLHTQLTF